MEMIQENFTLTPNLETAKLIQIKNHSDNRGDFFEAINTQKLESLIGCNPTCQINIARSEGGVLRGMHFQKEPHAQGKLVVCLQGIIQDIIVDLRKGSLTFGDQMSYVLTAEDPQALWVPKGFAHGYLVLSSSAIVMYGTTDYYHPECECSILWKDPTLHLNWLGSPEKITVSPKDFTAQTFEQWRTTHIH